MVEIYQYRLSNSGEAEQVVKSQSRGWEIYYDGACWRYSDDNTLLNENTRPCKRCGQYPTSEGYDACLGKIEGVSSACCGHGVDPPYFVWK